MIMFLGLILFLVVLVFENHISVFIHFLVSQNIYNYSVSVKILLKIILLNGFVWISVANKNMLVLLHFCGFFVKKYLY